MLAITGVVVVVGIGLIVWVPTTETRPVEQAVAAARAGEAGRGFAVVAAEARSLAQRSADAARQIKELITASVERVSQGTALEHDAGVAIRDMVEGVQAASIDQVGAAVGQIDQGTQQNAALVEEIAAAASSRSCEESKVPEVQVSVASS